MAESTKSLSNFFHKMELSVQEWDKKQFQFNYDIQVSAVSSTSTVCLLNFMITFIYSRISNFVEAANVFIAT